MDKEYIKNQYKLAYLDFRTARSENDAWDARKRMAKLEALASELYGFEWSDTMSNEVKGGAFSTEKVTK